MTPTSRMERAREIFCAAILLAEPERSSYLDRQCAGNHDLRKEIHELLLLDASADAPHTSPGAGGQWLARQLSDDDVDASPVPEVIGEFRIVREIGRGGMGIVYEALQQGLSRRVALKIIHPGLLGPGAVRRFQRETRAMAALRHPGIVQLFAAGSLPVIPGGPPRPYLAMELIEGQTLREYAAQESPALNTTLALLALIADAVHHAHQRGVIHRDLKPDNILVQPTAIAGSRGAGSGTGTHAAFTLGLQPKILDFGVSRLLETDDTAYTRTFAGQIVGTVPYMSPEQAAGDATCIDTRADVYALGVIAFELLSGRPPYRVEGLSTAAAVRLILDQAPARLRAVSRNIPADIQTIVHKAMHREPAQRYPSAAEFGADLRRYLAFEPILARRPSAFYITSRFIRRHRALAALSAASLLAIVVALIVIAALWQDARTTREAAVWQAYRSALSAASGAVASGDIATARHELESAPRQYRGWEFAHLASRLDQSRSTFRPAFAPPFSLHVESAEWGVLIRTDSTLRLNLRTGEVSESQKVVDSSGLDQVIRHAARTGRSPVIPVLPGAEPWAWALNAVPDRTAHAANFRGMGAGIRCLDITASADGSVVAALFDLAGDHEVVVRRQGQPVARRVPLDVQAHVSRIALSADGTRLFVASNEIDPDPMSIRMFDADALSLLSKCPGLSGRAFSLAALGGSRIAAVLQSGQMESWDLTPGMVTRLAKADYAIDAAENLSLSPDGALLASASRDGLVRVFNPSTLEQEFELYGHESEVIDLRFTPDSHSIITTGRDGTVRVWGAHPTAASPLVLRGHTHLVHPIAYAAGRGQVITGSWDRTIALWDLGDGPASAATVGNEPRMLQSRTLDALVTGLALSPDENLIATHEYLGKVRLFDARTLADRGVVNHLITRLDQPAFDLRSTRILLDYTAGENSALVWDIASASTRSIVGSELSEFTGVSFDRPHSLIAVTETRNSQRHTVLYRYTDGAEIASMPTSRSAVEALAFSPDGRWFAVPDDQYRIRITDAGTLRPHGLCTGHAREVLAMVFSPDCSRLFSADFNGQIRIWDTRTCEQVGMLIGHEAHIRRLVISPDGKRLISGSRDGTARVWEIP